MAIDVNSIKSQVSTENLSQTSSGADATSFDENLKIEQAKLEEQNKRTVLITPWAQIEKMFNFTSLTFDFDFSSKLEKDLNKEIEKESQSFSNLDRSENNFNQKTNQASAKNDAEKETLEVLFLKNGLVVGDPKLIPVAGNIVFDLKNRVPGLDLKSVIDSIIEKVRMVREKGKTELELSLKPEYLGKLRLKISVDDGVVSINFLASPETKDLLSENLAELVQALKNASINLGSLEIDVSSNSKERTAQEKEAAKAIDFNPLVSEKKEDIFAAPKFIDSELLKRIGWIRKIIISSEA